MERVLDTYSQPWDPRFPVVCMDEQPYQLLSETRKPKPMAPGRPAQVDDEYIREGCCAIWMFVEPLGQWREVGVSSRRTAIDWAERVRQLVDAPRFASAERITLVCDNLNTHDIGSLYTAFPPEEAKRVMDRLNLLFTPKHGSWLNIAESELSVLTRQALNDRLTDIPDIEQRITAWYHQRNQQQTGVDWHFTAHNARTKLKSLYPKINT